MFKPIRKAISIAVLIAFICATIKMPAYAQVDPMPQLPVPGTMISLSPAYTPAMLKGIVIHPEDALKFDFIVLRGDQAMPDDQRKAEYNKLLKYFLASLTVPDDDQWVNLSPYEKNRIIKDDFGKTEMGRDLLAEDYILKQITASLIYPEGNLGKEFWNRVYSQAQQQFGSRNIPVNTFNKVWIVPDNALIYEKGNTAYIINFHLKVMLEEDYLSLNKHNGINNPVILSKAKDLKVFKDSSAASQNNMHKVSSQIIRQIVIPQLEREINEGKNFATLRQVFSGVILAAWFKRALRESLLGKIYANKDKVKGVDQNPKTNEEIYHRYLQAYKKGVFNYIKEDIDKYTNQTIPRKYFSGGTVTMPREFWNKDVQNASFAQMSTDLAMRGPDEDVVAMRTKEALPANAAMASRINKLDKFNIIKRVFEAIIREQTAQMDPNEGIAIQNILTLDGQQIRALVKNKDIRNPLWALATPNEYNPRDTSLRAVLSWNYNYMELDSPQAVEESLSEVYQGKDINCFLITIKGGKQFVWILNIKNGTQILFDANITRSTFYVKDGKLQVRNRFNRIMKFGVAPATLLILVGGFIWLQNKTNSAFRHSLEIMQQVFDYRPNTIEESYSDSIFSRLFIKSSIHKPQQYWSNVGYIRLWLFQRGYPEYIGYFRSLGMGMSEGRNYKPMLHMISLDEWSLIQQAYPGIDIKPIFAKNVLMAGPSVAALQELSKSTNSPEQQISHYITQGIGEQNLATLRDIEHFLLTHSLTSPKDVDAFLTNLQARIPSSLMDNEMARELLIKYLARWADGYYVNSKEVNVEKHKGAPYLWILGIAGPWYNHQTSIEQIKDVHIIDGKDIPTIFQQLQQAFEKMILSKNEEDKPYYYAVHFSPEPTEQIFLSTLDPKNMVLVTNKDGQPVDIYGNPLETMSQGTTKSVSTNVSAAMTVTQKLLDHFKLADIRQLSDIAYAAIDQEDIMTINEFYEALDNISLYDLQQEGLLPLKENLYRYRAVHKVPEPWLYIDPLTKQKVVKVFCDMEGTALNPDETQKLDQLITRRNPALAELFKQKFGLKSQIGQTVDGKFFSKENFRKIIKEMLGQYIAPADIEQATKSPKMVPRFMETLKAIQKTTGADRIDLVFVTGSYTQQVKGYWQSAPFQAAIRESGLNLQVVDSRTDTIVFNPTINSMKGPIDISGENELMLVKDQFVPANAIYVGDKEEQSDKIGDGKLQDRFERRGITFFSVDKTNDLEIAQALAKKLQTTIPNTSAAMTTKANRNSFGGIDFNSANMAMTIKRDGKGVPLPLAQQDLAQLSNNLQGLEPVILSIQPAQKSSVFTELLNS